MRILMISDFYHPFVGGVEQHVRSLGAALVERGHEVAVATLGRDDLPSLDIDRGVRVYRMKGSAQRVERLFLTPGRPWAPPLPDPELTWSLRDVIRRERPEIVHGHDWLSRSFLPLKAWSRAKLIVSLHYYTLTCAKKNLLCHDAPCDGPAPLKCARCAGAHYGLAKGLPALAGTWMGKKMERHGVDMFVGVSQATIAGNGLVDGSSPHRVIPNFLPPVHRASSDDVAPYVAQLPATDYLLFVGDLRRAKGLEVLLRAYADLETTVPLVLIGKTWPETPQSLPPNVIVLKDWPNTAVMEAWRRATLAIVPSIWPEPFGIVVIEAMSGECPVVASRIGGIPEIVVEGETGLLVPPADPDALRDAIARLLGNRETMQRMGRAGRRRAGLFQADAVVPQIEGVYREVLDGMGHGLCQPDSHPPFRAESMASSPAPTREPVGRGEHLG
jgi:glycosyltransferase involved in cell wall biosynthesis